MRDATENRISISPRMFRLLADSVESGEFASTHAAMEDALAFWQRHRADVALRLSPIKDRIRISLDDPLPSVTANEPETAIRAFVAKANKDATG